MKLTRILFLQLILLFIIISGLGIIYRTNYLSFSKSENKIPNSTQGDKEFWKRELTEDSRTESEISSQKEFGEKLVFGVMGAIGGLLVLCAIGLCISLRRIQFRPNESRITNVHLSKFENKFPSKPFFTLENKFELKECQICFAHLKSKRRSANSML